ncbi:unnamed protein product [Caenorhabditis brenneri]
MKGVTSFEKGLHRFADIINEFTLLFAQSLYIYASTKKDATVCYETETLLLNLRKNKLLLKREVLEDVAQEISRNLGAVEPTTRFPNPYLQSQWPQISGVKPGVMDDPTKMTDVCTCARYYENEWDEIGELGRGYFGIVYHMREKKTSNEFAMKMIDSDMTKAADQFNEAWRSKRRHDNVVWLTSCVYLPHGFTGKGHILICMELCSKKTLQKWLEENPTQRSLDYVKPYMWQILSALCCLHGQRIIHRDLKPSNIMFATDAEYAKKGGMLKIGDFGMITRCIDEAEDRQNKKSLERGSFETRVHKHTYGALLYESPEKSGLIYNNKIDVFSYGLICAELLCEFAHPGARRAVFDILRTGQNPKLLTKQPPEVKDFIKSATKPEPSERLFATDLRKHSFFEGFKQRPKLQLFAQSIYLKNSNVFDVVKLNVQKSFEKEKDKLSFAQCESVQDIMDLQSKLFTYMFPNSAEEHQERCARMTNEEKLGRSCEMCLIPPFKAPGVQCCRLGMTIPFFIKLLPKETVPLENKSEMVHRIKNLQLAMTGSLDVDAKYENYSLDEMSKYVDYLYDIAKRMGDYETTFFGLETESKDRLDKGSLVKLIPGIDIWHKHPLPDYVEDLFGFILHQADHQDKTEFKSKDYYESTQQIELEIREKLIPISWANFFTQKTMKETLSNIIQLSLPSDREMVLMRIKTIARVLNSREINIRHWKNNDAFPHCYLLFLIKACKFILEMSKEEVYFNICFSNSLVHVALSPVIDTNLVLPTFEVFSRYYWTNWSNIGWKVFAHIAREHKSALEKERELLKNGEKNRKSQAAI